MVNGIASRGGTVVEVVKVIQEVEAGEVSRTESWAALEYHSKSN